MNKTLSANGWQGFLLGLLAFACYSAGDVVVKKLSADFGVLQIFAINSLVAMPFMLAMVWRRDRLVSLQTRAIHKHALRGVLFLAQSFSAFYGFQHLPMADTYTFIFVMPVFTLIFAVIFLRELVTRLQVVLIVTAFTGVLIVFRPGIEALNIAALIVLAGSMVGGLNQVYMRHLSGAEGFGASLIYPVFFATVIAAVLAISDWRLLNLEQLGLFLISGTLAALAHGLIVSAFYLAPASQVAPTQYSQIIWGVLYGYLFFTDVPDLWVIAGAALIIFAGMWLAKIEHDGIGMRHG